MALTCHIIGSVKPAGKSYRLTDGHGLYIEVRPNGSKLWRYRYEIQGKENIYSIGRYCPSNRHEHMSLSAARDARDAARMLVKQGIHPLHRRDLKQEEVVAPKVSFQMVAEEWILKNAPNRSASFTAQIRHVLEESVYPVIGAIPVNDVAPSQIVEILQAAAGNGAGTYSILIRQWISSIYRHAVATLRADHNPAAHLKDVVAQHVPKPTKALSPTKLKAVVQSIEAYNGEKITVLGIQLLLLTLVRTSELCGARWEEFDLSAAVWRIPAHRMKMRQLHLVPLARQVLEVLASLKTLHGQQEFVLPAANRPGTCMDRTTFNQALRRMGFGSDASISLTANGFRETAREMLSAAGFHREIVETQLSHHPHRSYVQKERLELRRNLMQSWANIVDEFAG
jgi:integrase